MNLDKCIYIWELKLLSGLEYSYDFRSFPHALSQLAPTHISQRNHSSFFYHRWILPFLEPHISRIIQYLLFCVRLLSDSFFFFFFRFIHFIAKKFSFFLNIILLYECTTVFSFIPLLMDIWAISNFWHE